MKIERKTTFIVCGVEFQTLQVAQFFQLAIKRDMQINDDCDAQASADRVLDRWKCLLGKGHDLNFVIDSPALMVNIIMRMQLPKAPRKEKPIAPKEFNFEMIPEEDNPPN